MLRDKPGIRPSPGVSAPLPIRRNSVFRSVGDGSCSQEALRHIGELIIVDEVGRRGREIGQCRPGGASQGVLIFQSIRFPWIRVEGDD